ncbi:MAG: type IX secretion system membrane protein PorP/SprF [Cyclobacteriaceae bacterium]|nr:type IX secretion system membrane protein PorP/SprF [Cyclobacteriaceae bacterium]
MKNLQPLLLKKLPRRPVLISICILHFTFCILHSAPAQQDPIYASYMMNPLTINPAYAGSNNMLNGSLQYRTQWAGLDANPTTVNFSAHMSALRNKIGAGLMVIQDQLGDTKNTEFQGVFSYKIQLNNSWLSFGMQSGFIRYQTDPSKLTIRDPGDPAFVQLTETKFNTGVGIILKSDNYMVGVSVPRLLPATVSQGGQEIELYKQTYYLFGSYAWLLNENIRFKPSVLMRATAGSPLSYDVNASMTFREKYTGGLFTRNFNTYGLLAQMMVDKFRFGYVFELPVGSSNLNFTTHEITVGLAMHVLSFHDRAMKIY